MIKFTLENPYKLKGASDTHWLEGYKVIRRRMERDGPWLVQLLSNVRGHQAASSFCSHYSQ